MRLPISIIQNWRLMKECKVQTFTKVRWGKPMSKDIIGYFLDKNTIARLITPVFSALFNSLFANNKSIKRIDTAYFVVILPILYV